MKMNSFVKNVPFCNSGGYKREQYHFLFRFGIHLETHRVYVHGHSDPSEVDIPEIFAEEDHIWFTDIKTKIDAEWLVFDVVRKNSSEGYRIVHRVGGRWRSLHVDSGGATNPYPITTIGAEQFISAAILAKLPLDHYDITDYQYFLPTTHRLVERYIGRNGVSVYPLYGNKFYLQPFYDIEQLRAPGRLWINSNNQSFITDAPLDDNKYVISLGEHKMSLVPAVVLRCAGEDRLFELKML